LQHRNLAAIAFCQNTVRKDSVLSGGAGAHASHSHTLNLPWEGARSRATGSGTSVQ
jgi:hypothetical protein